MSSIRKRVGAVLGVLAMSAATALIAITPAHAAPGNIDPTTPRSLTVHKYALSPSSPQQIGTGQELTTPPAGTPLAGAVFTAELVADVDLTTSTGWSTAAALTPASAANRLSGTSFTSTASAPGTGIATFPTTMPIGLYLVTETTLPAEATNPSAPFLVTLPFPTGPTGAPANEWIYDVHVYPKNAVTDVTKTRVPAPANSAEARNPDLIRWAIAAAVPTLAAGDSIDTFELTDTIPADLVFVDSPPTGVSPTNVVVTNAAGLPQSFVAGTDYNITTAGDTLTLEFTTAGLTRLTGLQGGVVTFNVLTRAVSIPADGRIVNTASGTINGSTETVTGVTPIGQLTVFAYEGPANDRVPLAGAVYQVFLTEEDAIRGTNPIFINGVDRWTTDATGYVEIPIITPGNYWVREITPPAGFQLPSPDRIYTQVVAGETSTVPPIQNYVEFAHNQVPAWQLPLTGGDGARWFGIGGGALLVTMIGAAVFLSRRRQAAARAAA
jgi:fimbrial isopeptide formation D2 family protein/LPXTG-motif cell wall-anchored protein